MKSLLYSFLVLIFAVTFVACGGGSSDSETTPSETEEATEASSGSVGVEVTIQPVGEEMKYAVDTLTVAAGTELTLIFENTATLPIMVHNVVILTTNNDEDVNRIGMAAITAGEENGYLPEDDAILAATPMAQPGETVQVTFTVPSEPGVHRFICTYPGHYALMQGVLVVT
ncbi:MAG: plastocyanin/azurin family copper-binding protein [Bacteroidota bacterium]|nr:plastocyanin/azurin family copper-binding protein [Bacteroidota bacterium]MXW15200.1 auracyanin [Rhodothermaceae bacterium]MDE2644860.1 plastocyanin/azurin family copper-binding protein [Bacteroidota bacterium]MXW31659.1 auracyanin [Rhodothermaceae bacterium]MYC03849.1 auracyanin [Rhodothermaceae bacterium]